VNGLLFFNVAHIGVGAEVTRSLDKGSKAVWGKLSYAKRAVDVFKKNRPFFAHVD
jgi:diacylglycerol kinase family enzyme